MFCLLAGVSRVKSSAQSSDKHRFHERCSNGVTLSSSRRTARCYFGLFGAVPGTVLSHEPLADDQLFEVKIDAVGNNYYPIPRSNKLFLFKQIIIV